MARKGPIPRPRRRSDHRGRRGATVIALTPRSTAPKVPRGNADWLPATRRQWREFWLSDLSQLATDLDVDALRRLFGMRDELARIREVTKVAMVVRGSMGQMRINPLLTHAMQLEGAILHLEGEYGLTPSARLRLGVKFGEAASTLDDLNRRLARSQPGVRPDPRRAALEPDHGPEGEGE